MDQYYSKNSIKNLALICLSLSTILILLCSWEPLIITYKPLFSSHNHSSTINQVSVVQKEELQIALEKASMPNKTVIIAFVNKAYVEPNENEYPTMLDLFLEGFWAGERTRPLVDQGLLVVAMDGTAEERCEFRRLNCYRMPGDDDGRFAGEKVYMSDEFIEMMWRRTLFLLDVLKRGYNFVFTDTDVLWLRNPLKRLMMNKNETIDLQISTDVFNGNASSEQNLINTGFYFIRSNERTIKLFETWYDRRKNSTGLKEQDVLANLIREGVLGELELKTRFLDTVYFSGFCKDSRNVRLVTTVHANCCRSISAKVADLKVVLKDWKRFKSKKVDEDLNIDSRKRNRRFRWSQHISCINSWLNNTVV